MTFIEVHSCPICKSPNTVQSGVPNKPFAGQIGHMTKWICEECNLNFTVMWDAREEGIE